ncbi:unnamed protein product [Symbiodinium microadriaticum]|nr:unnamed protein product [Symbiodinium microadriaticum]
MGGKSWHSGRDNKYGQKYWRGSYRAYSPQQRDNVRFPAYDAPRSSRNAWDYVDRPERNNPAEDSNGAAPSFVQVIQASLNSARKAEQKVKNLQDKIAEKNEQWKHYVEDLKAAWVKESQRHEKAMAKLAEELEAANRQQDVARTELRDAHYAVTHGQAHVRPQVERGANWEELLGQWRQEGATMTPEAVLQRAFHAGSMPSSYPPPPGLAASVRPPPEQTRLERELLSRSGGQIPMETELPEPRAERPSMPTETAERNSGPPTHPAGSAQTIRTEQAAYFGPFPPDPYLQSPSGAYAKDKIGQPSPRTNPYEGQRPLEQTACPSANTPDELAVRLANKRAMEPFGGPQRRPTTDFLQQIDPSKRPVPTLVTDEDELAAGEDGTKPPDQEGLPHFKEFLDFLHLERGHDMKFKVLDLELFCGRPFLQHAWQQTNCTPQQVTTDLLPESFHVRVQETQEGHTEPLPDTYDLQDKFREDWLGVAVYSPYFPTTAFAMRVEPGASIEHVCQMIKASGRLPCPLHDSLVAVHPQVFPGYLSVLSYPSIIAQGRRPHCAVIIDISRVGGTVYAATLPIDSKLTDLWSEIGQSMNVDIETEDVLVWIGDASLPASYLGTLSVSNGTLVTVCRPTAASPTPPVAFHATALLGSKSIWDKVEHMPRPSAAHCLAVAYGPDLNPIVLAFFPRFFKQEIALRVSKLTAAQADVVIVDNDPPLDLKGEPCTQTAIVLPKAEGQCAYFLDTRSIGVVPKLVTSAESLPDLQQILSAADIEFPEGWRGDLLANTLKDNVQVLKVGSAVELAHKVFAAEFKAASEECPPTGSCPVPPFDPAEGANSAPGAPPTEVGPPAPRRHGQPPTSPEALEALRLEPDEEDDEDQAGLINLVETVFLVFAPRYKHEVYSILLPIDCSVDEAMHQVADMRDSANTICFPCLTPVNPQPTTAFACILATPVWVASGICLVDARSVDAGIFAYYFDGRIKRESILIQLGHSIPSDLQVWCNGAELADEVLYEFPTGSLLVLLTAGGEYIPRGTLRQMLSSSRGWSQSDPFLHPDHRTDFLMMHEGGQKVLTIDLENEDSSAKFKQTAADVFLFDVTKVTACPSVPRILDCAHLGQLCIATVVVTEAISRIPIPPGRPLLMKHIVFIDRRPFLKDFTWALATLGILDVDRLLRSHQDHVPFGHSLSLTGGRREYRDERTFVRVAHGEVLTLTYVEDPPTVGRTESGSDGNSPEGEESDSSGHDGDSSRGDSIFQSSDSRCRGGRDDSHRSRSPRRGPPPPPGACITLAFADSLGKLSPRAEANLYDTLLGFVGAPGKIAAHTYHPGIAPPLPNLAYVGETIGLEEFRPLILEGFEVYKLLTEPVGSTPIEEQHLQDLRTVTERMGGNWLAQRQTFLPAGLIQDAADANPAAAVADPLQYIGCAVLKVGYVPELLTIGIALPATPEEAEAIAQAARCPRIRQKFPWITPVSPQPGIGAACYVASPSWLPNSQDICFDTTHIDGRLFVAQAPDYVARHELLQLAGVSSFPGLGVWVGPDYFLLDNEEPIHTFTGMLISFRPRDREPVAPYSLGQLLLFLDGWHDAPEWPDSRFGPAHILVHRGSTLLISARHREPWRYRHIIGEAVGADHTHMQLFAAAPRQTDAALNGVHCCTVIAVGLPPAPAVQRYWHCALVDCRHIRDGWLELILYEGVLDVQELSVVLNDSAPVGWYVHIDVMPQRAGCVYLNPGHVILATYEDHPQVFPEATEQPAPESATNDGHGEERPQSDSSDSEDQPSQTSSPEGPDTVEAEAMPPTNITCFLFAPDFYPAEVTVPTFLPTNVEDFVDLVQAHRTSEDLHSFSQLCVVHPQPDPVFVCLLAIPEWPSVRIPILIHSYGHAPYTFAVFLPPVITHDDVLTLAGVSDALGYRVFHRDLPWPVPERGEIRLEPGDLLTVARPDRHVPGWTLADTLLWTYGWFQPEQPPGQWPGGSWLVTDTEDRHAFIALPSGRASLQVAADALSLDPATLFICPAYPPILDHARRGRFSDNVVIAVVPEDHPRPEDVLYVLDLRPILFPIRVMRAPAGRVEISFLYGMLSAHCPSGYFITIEGGTCSPGAANHYRNVECGDVIRVEFRARRLPDVPRGSQAPTPITQDAPDSYPGGDAHATTESSSSASRDAGTGGSHRTSTDGRPSAHTLLTPFVVLSGVRAGTPLPDGALRLFQWTTSKVARAALTSIISHLGVGLVFLLAYSFHVGVSFATALYPRHPVRVLFLLYTMQHAAAGVQLPPGFGKAVYAPTLGGDASIATRIRAVPRPLHPTSRDSDTRDTAPQSISWTGSENRRQQPRDNPSPAGAEIETLLEQSLRDPSSQAMFLAATLVEALHEHFAVNSEAESTAIALEYNSRELQLSLATHLPAARTFDLTSVQVHVGCTVDHMATLFHDGVRCLAPFPDFPTGYPRTWASERPPACWERSPHTAQVIEIYTDGSFDGGCSSWAFHASGDWGEGFRTLGWIGDQVEIDAESPLYLGAQLHGALQGELSALFWCLVWILPISPEVPVTIYSDCLSAIGVAEGRAGQFRGIDLAARCRHMLQAVKARTHSDHVTIQHVKSHVGYAGNEAADYLAKECAAMLGLEGTPATDHGPTSVEAVLEAALLTVNVQSLCSDAAPGCQPALSDDFPGKAGLLREQLAEWHVSVTALQETRAPKNETIQSKTHIRFCSARDAQGSYGTELWFSKTIPFIRHDLTPICFRIDDFLAVHWDPRVIAVRFSRGNLRLLFVSQPEAVRLSGRRHKVDTKAMRTAEGKAALRASSTDRAYGLDEIPGEVLRYGGTLYCIWKGKGPKQTCGSYRGCTETLANCAVPLQDRKCSYALLFLDLQVLRQVRESLDTVGATAQIPWTDSMNNNIDPLTCAPDSWLGVTDATWMDDLVMFLTHPDASSLIRNLKVGASTLLDSCLQRALIPNLTRGKTEAIVHACGPGARKVRSEIFGADGGSVELACRLWEDARLRIVPIYRHLGGYLQHNGGLRQEISFRTSQAWDAFNKRKKRLFQSPLVSSGDKAVFFTSLISTVLFHGAGTWTSVTEQHVESIEATLRQMACQMLRPQVSVEVAWHLGTAQALARAGIPRASTYLHVARLRHILACFQLPVPEIWALAHWERHWLASVRESIQWMWRLIDGGSHYATWSDAWRDWQVDCSSHPGRWKSKIRRVLRKALQQERWQATVEQHHGLLVRQLRLGGAAMPRVSTPNVAVREVCALCNVVFGDFRAWSVHAFKCHGRTEEVRLHVTACVWHAHLGQKASDPTDGSPLITFLLQAAHWVTGVDFADWLAPEPAGRPHTHSTFRHSELNLGLLDFSGVRLPAPLSWTADHVLVCIGQWPPKSLDTRGVPEPLVFAHEASLATLADGRELDFFAEAPTEVGFLINTCGLPVPTVDCFDKAPHVEDFLPALRLSCDLVRFALRLWMSGIRTCLHVPWPCGVDVSSLINIEGVRFQQGDDRATLWVGSQEAAPSPKAPATPPQKEDRRWADEIAKQRRAMAKKEKEAEDTGCSLYSFFQCNGFERSFLALARAQREFINEQRKDSRKKETPGKKELFLLVLNGCVTSTPKGQMRQAPVKGRGSRVRLYLYIDEYGGEKALQARFPNGRFKPLLDKKPASEL